MASLERYRAQLDRCCGRVPKARRPKTGIEKEREAALEEIAEEYRREFEETE